MALDAINRITSPTDSHEYKVSNGMVLGVDAQVKWSVNSIYECVNANNL